MNIEICYAAMEGDYAGVLSRLRTEERIKKFALKFLKDTSYQTLCDSLASSDYETAFRASHTLKGVCQNLGFTKLYESSHELTELLRDGAHPDMEKLFARVTADYRQTVDALQQLDT